MHLDFAQALSIILVTYIRTHVKPEPGAVETAEGYAFELLIKYNNKQD